MAHDTGTADASAPVSPGAPPNAHVVPVRVLATVLAGLLVLTLLTVAAARGDLGRLNIWIALGIATLKATLVILYFMHLRYGRPFYGIVLVTTLLFLSAFIGLTVMDTSHYGKNIERFRGEHPDQVAPLLDAERMRESLKP
jgi:cytochrome c oxidase subunit 4